MRYSTTLLPIVLSLTVMSQPEINVSNTQLVPGPSYMVNLSALQEGGAGGPDAVWDFSSLITTQQATVSLLEPLGSGLEDVMPSATVFTFNDLSETAKGYQASLAGVSFWGTFNNNNQVLLAYSDASLELSLPCAFGTTWTDFNLGQFTLGGSVIGSRTGELTGEADGYGDLVMPFGTISNVLRVHLTESVSDVTTAGNGTTTASRYQYFKPGIPAPLVETVNAVTNGPNGQTTQQVMQWLAAGTVGIDQAVRSTIGLEVFPQPAHGNVTITFGAQGDVDFNLFDSSGRMVRSFHRSDLSPGLHQTNVDLSGLTPGIYTINAVSDHQERGSLRIVVE